MKLLTFLGVGNYQLTTYTWNGQEYSCKFAPAASARFLKPGIVIVFLTKEAQQQVYPEFAAAMPAELAIQPIPVPLGRDEQELWQIFSQVSAAVQPGEEVAFDITHGLRSFPLLGLLAAAFLSTGLNVHLVAVLYGAYDIRDTSVIPHRTPMFDLSAMISLLEWASAADRFKSTGDARYLASLLKQQQKELAMQAQAAGDHTQLDQAGQLGALSTNLTDISQALKLIRPYRTMEATAHLADLTEKARPALAQAAASSPFSLLLNDVVQAYAPLGQDDPSAPENVVVALQKQLLMIKWYIERELWVQAVTMAREWLVSWIMVQLGHTNLLDRNLRSRVEQDINSEAAEFRYAKENKKSFMPVFLASIASFKEVFSLWFTLVDVRNDINHAGLRKGSKLPQYLIKTISSCAAKLKELPLE